MKLYISEVAKKLDSSYYGAVKDIVSKISGVPKGQFEEVSTRDRDIFGFREGCVTLIINPWDKGKKRKASVDKFLQHLDEIKRAFNNNCDIMEVEPFNTYSIIVSQETIDNLNGNNNTANVTDDREDTISFWATTVFDTRTTAVAYGAKIKCADGWSFPGSLGRIQQKLGERRFYYFSKGSNKSFKTYESLVKFLKSIDVHINIPSKEDIIEAGYDEKYFTN